MDYSPLLFQYSPITLTSWRIIIERNMFNSSVFTYLSYSESKGRDYFLYFICSSMHSCISLVIGKEGFPFEACKTEWFSLIFLPLFMFRLMWMVLMVVKGGVVIPQTALAYFHPFLVNLGIYLGFTKIPQKLIQNEKGSS